MMARDLFRCHEGGSRVEMFNALGFSAVCVVVALILVMSAPRRGAWFGMWLGIAGILVICAIALPVGLSMLP